jgi:glycerol-3-phosphate dehydrogenase subunit B
LSATSLKVWHAQEFVLATGGVTSGGIVVESNREAHESVFQLPIFGLTHDGPGFSTNYFESHHFSRVGLRVDEKARPINVNGDAVFENLRAAGGILAGAEPWKEKSGEGIALATGFLAAESIINHRQAPETSIKLARVE